jgi:hypothetical protein
VLSEKWVKKGLAKILVLSNGEPVLICDDKVYEPVTAALKGIEICWCDDDELLKKWIRLHNQTVGGKY